MTFGYREVIQTFYAVFMEKNSNTPFSKALIISENPSTQALVDLYLEAENIQANIFQDVSSAFNHLKENTPSLIVLEQGIEPDVFVIASRLKMVKRLREVPIILLLSETNERTRITAELLRTDFVLTKPVNGKRFRDIVRGSMQFNYASVV